MKKTFTVFAATLALAGGLAMAQTATAPATPAVPHARQHMRMMRQRIAQQLNLTDAQKAQAKSIFQQSREQTKPVRDQLKTNRQALAAAVKANDTGQIQQLSQQEGSLLSQLVAARAEARAQFYQILTPDQKAKADQMAAHFKARMQQRAARRSNG
jgi:Spy/CpxP family protein refolding chaperone